MLIVLANNKGGQGKSMIATLLTKYLISNPENKGNILCCDLDHTQRNFTDNVSGLPIVTSLAEIETDKLCILDTPPGLNDEVVDAIQKADILVVPIILGKHAVQGTMRVAEIRGKIDDLKIVVNFWNNSAAQREAEKYLVSQGFNIYGKLSNMKRLTFNIDAGHDWYTGLFEYQKLNIIDILDRTLKG